MKIAKKGGREENLWIKRGRKGIKRGALNTGESITLRTRRRRVNKLGRGIWRGELLNKLNKRAD